MQQENVLSVQPSCGKLLVIRVCDELGPFSGFQYPL